MVSYYLLPLLLVVHQAKDSDISKVKRAVEFLGKVPAIQRPDPKKSALTEQEQTSVLAALRTLLDFDDIVLREAYVCFLVQRGEWNNSALATLYIANRFIFDFPMGQKSGAQPLRGFPLDKEPTGMWPLLDDGKNFTGVASVVMFVGPYSPLDEFDTFRSRFGRRKFTK